MGNLFFACGDATQPETTGPAVICHICNDIGAWGRGFVLAISQRWPQPEREYRRWFAREKNSSFRLGAVQFVQVEPELWVANMIAQHGLRNDALQGKPPIRYEAVEVAFRQVVKFAEEKKASIHMPRIGCGLAGATWTKIDPIVQSCIEDSDVEVTVYDPACVAA